MKVRYTFNLPEEQEEHEEWAQGPKAMRALYDLECMLRALDKHSDDTHIEIEEMREKFYEIVNNQEVTL